MIGSYKRMQQHQTTINFCHKPKTLNQHHPQSSTKTFQKRSTSLKSEPKQSLRKKFIQDQPYTERTSTELIRKRHFSNQKKKTSNKYTDTSIYKNTKHSNQFNQGGVYVFHDGHRYVTQFLSQNTKNKNGTSFEQRILEKQFQLLQVQKQPKQHLQTVEKAEETSFQIQQVDSDCIIQTLQSEISMIEIKQSLKQQKVNLTFSNNITFDGVFKSNNTQYGVLTYPNGSKFQGELQNLVKSGPGKLTYPNGDYYIGDFESDTFNGFGQYYYKNGDSYVGYFKDGLPHTHGTFTYQCGTAYKGMWKEGKKVQSGEWIGLQNYGRQYQILVDSIFSKDKNKTLKYKSSIDGKQQSSISSKNQIMGPILIIDEYPIKVPSFEADHDSDVNNSEKISFVYEHGKKYQNLNK